MRPSPRSSTFIPPFTGALQIAFAGTSWVKLRKTGFSSPPNIVGEVGRLRHSEGKPPIRIPNDGFSSGWRGEACCVLAARYGKTLSLEQRKNEQSSTLDDPTALRPSIIKRLHLSLGKRIVREIVRFMGPCMMVDDEGASQEPAMHANWTTAIAEPSGRLSPTVMTRWTMLNSSVDQHDDNLQHLSERFHQPMAELQTTGDPKGGTGVSASIAQSPFRQLFKSASNTVSSKPCLHPGIHTLINDLLQSKSVLAQLEGLSRLCALTPVHRLPAELLGEIFVHVDTDDLTNVALVCSAWNAASATAVLGNYSTLCIIFKPEEGIPCERIRTWLAKVRNAPGKTLRLSHGPHYGFELGLPNAVLRPHGIHFAR
ncbi:hypothetical protein NMY22_g11643 [Coprinellus aureogranulatus]|nr:hypothetical protein NMY22_g11643 [Coprinellus aureogranulatus]